MSDIVDNKHPPVFTGENFPQWKKRVLLWSSQTDMPPEKQGAHVLMNLRGSASSFIDSVEIAQITTNGGLKVLIDGLEHIYGTENTQSLLDVYEEWRKVQRLPSEKEEFITRFLQLHNKCVSAGIKIDDKLCSLHMISSANLAPEQYSNLKTMIVSRDIASSWKLTDIVALVRQCIIPTVSHSDELSVSQPVGSVNRFVPRHKGKGKRNWTPKGKGKGKHSDRFLDNRYSGNRYPQSSFRDHSYSGPRSQKRSHSFRGKHGKGQSQHSVSYSIPKHNESDDFEYDYLDDNFVGMVISSVTVSRHPCEDFRYAIIDSGCQAPICSLQFFHSYLQELRRLNVSYDIQEENCRSTFSFPNSSVGEALFSCWLPVFIGKFRCNIQVHVFRDLATSFLLSLNVLEQLGVCLDFRNSSISIDDFGICDLKLSKDMNGNLLLPLFLGFRQQSTSTILKEVPLPRIPVSPLSSLVGNGFATVLAARATSLLRDVSSFKSMQKLHVNLGHASRERLYLYLRQLGASKGIRSMIDQVLSSCSLCQTTRVFRPKTSGFICQEFNFVLFMDITELIVQNTKFLVCVMVDCHSRFMHADVLPDKTSASIVSALMQWKRIAGSYPNIVFCDNAAEHLSDTTAVFLQFQNVQVRTTLPYTPEQNGVVERSNQTLKLTFHTMFRQLLTDFPELVASFQSQSRLARAVIDDSLSVLNALPGRNGLCPYYIAFTRFPVFATSFADLTPSQYMNISELPQELRLRMTVQQRVSDLVFTEKILTKVKEALRSRMYGNVKTVYKSGDSVMVKVRTRTNRSQLLGPCTIVGFESPFYHVTHNGRCVKVKPEQIQCEPFSSFKSQSSLSPRYQNSRTSKCSPSASSQSGPIFAPYSSANVPRNAFAPIPRRRPAQFRSFSENPKRVRFSENLEVDPKQRTFSLENFEVNTSMDENTEDVPMRIGSPMRTPWTPITGIKRRRESFGSERGRGRNTKLTNNTDPDNVSVPSSPVQDASTSNPPQLALENAEDEMIMEKCPKCGIEVEKCEMQTHLELFCVSSRQNQTFSVGKVSIQDIQADGTATGMRKVTRKDLNSFERDFNDAKRKELESWKTNNVYELIEYDDSLHKDLNLVDMKWVNTWKSLDNHQIIAKSRLVLRGFMDKEKCQLRVDSPTVSKIGVRYILQTAVNKSQIPGVIDIKTAFLQTPHYEESDSRNVFGVPPDDFAFLLGLDMDKQYILRLRKSIYGLSDAPRRFFLAISSTLKRLGLRVCTEDNGLFVYEDSTGIHGIIGLHVDDILFVGDSSFQKNVIDKLKVQYRFGKIAFGVFTYCGLNVRTTMNENGQISIEMSQNDYVQSIQLMQVPDRPRDSSLNSYETTRFRSVTGNLGWISNGTRPDISFDTNVLSSVQSSAKVSDVFTLNKTVKTAQASKVQLDFATPHDTSTSLVVYADSALANVSECGSQGAGLFFFCTKRERGKYSLTLVDWFSKRLRRVARSSLTAECMAVGNAIDQALYLSSIWKFVSGKSLDIYVFNDNKNLINLSHNDNSGIEEKRLLTELGAIRGYLRDGSIKDLLYVPTDFCLADSLTKSKANRTKKRLLSVLKDHYIDSSDLPMPIQSD